MEDTESPKATLSSQPSLHDMSDIPTDNGLAKREVTKFTDTWNNICKNSLVGQGHILQQAAIAAHTGNIYSCCPDEFLPTVEQIKVIVSAMRNPAVLAVAGINVGSERFSYSSCQVSGSTAHSFTGDRADGNGGILIYITKHTILIGVYKGESKAKKEQAMGLLEDIWNWVRDTGF